MKPALITLLIARTPESRRRLVAITAGVAIGVALFTLLWGSYLGLQVREERGQAFFNQFAPSVIPLPAEHGAGGGEGTVSGEGSVRGEEPGGVDGAPGRAQEPLSLVRQDLFMGHEITLVQVSEALPGSLTLNGVPTPPPLGSSLASPALAQLIRDAEPEILGDRYGVPAGSLPDATLISPDSLFLVQHVPYDRLLGDPNTTSIQPDIDHQGVSQGIMPQGARVYGVVAAIGGIALLVPVLVFISVVTNLGAAQRRERFATVRLIGGSPVALAAVVASETAVTTLLGGLLGFGLAWLLRPLAAQVEIHGGSFFPEDLAVSPQLSFAVLAALVGATSVAAGWRMLRADPGALGNVSHAAERPVWLWRGLPLLLGAFTMTVVAVLRSNQVQVPQEGNLLLGGFFLVSVGLILAGPWLTRVISQAVARRAGSAAAVIAVNRIGRTPRATFRAVSGLVIGVFAITVFAVFVTSERFENRPAEGPGFASSATLIAHSYGGYPPELLEQLSNTAGVVGIAELGLLTVESPPGEPNSEITRIENSSEYATVKSSYVVRSKHLASLDLGMDLAALAPQGIDPDTLLNVGTDLVSSGHLVIGDTPSPVTLEVVVPDPGTAPEWNTYLIATDGSAAALERARTVLSHHSNSVFSAPATRVENNYMGVESLAESYTTLANLGLVVVAGIAALALAVSTSAAVIDRRRVFGLLRLTGMPSRTLRGIITWEALLPFLSILLLAVGCGVLTCWAVLAGLTEGRRHIGWPEPSFFVVFGVTLLLGVGAVVASFGSASRHTGQQVTRFE